MFESPIVSQGETQCPMLHPKTRAQSSELLNSSELYDRLSMCPLVMIILILKPGDNVSRLWEKLAVTAWVTVGVGFSMGSQCRIYAARAGA